MKKSFYLLFACITILSLALTACGENPTPTQDCTSPDVLCVGLVTDVGKIDDKSFNQSAWEGVVQARDELGAVVDYVETIESKDYEKNIAYFADQNYDAIVTVGFALGEATILSARKYPDIKFIGVDQFQGETIPNLAGLIFPEDQAGFLVGALAAQITKTNKIGGVFATDDVPPVWKFGEGYRAGATYINPSIEVFLDYHSDVGYDKTFSDPEWGAEKAKAQVEKGVDVIFGAGGKTGNAGVVSAVEAGILAIGVDTDQYYTLPEVKQGLLSSAMKLITPGVFDLLGKIKEGKFTGGNITGDVTYAPFHDQESIVTPEIKAKLDEIHKAFKDGTLATNVAPAKP